MASLSWTELQPLMGEAWVAAAIDMGITECSIPDPEEWIEFPFAILLKKSLPQCSSRSHHEWLTAAKSLGCPHRNVSDIKAWLKDHQPRVLAYLSERY